MLEKVLLIPGPIEYDPSIYSALSTHSKSHVSPEFIKTFQQVLKQLRFLLYSSGQPFVLCGSGTLGWEFVAGNWIKEGDVVLVIESGVFGRWFGECLETFGAKINYVSAEFGAFPEEEEIKNALKQHRPSLVTITHVDTSTAVLAPLQRIASIVRENSDALIAVDGVCSVASEELRMDEWGLDFCLTGSQKGLGIPPGLCIALVSMKALQVRMDREIKPKTYYASVDKWLPIMRAYESETPSYFATPSTNLIFALGASLKLLINSDFVGRHRETSLKFKKTVKELGMELVVDGDYAANSMTAIYYPKRQGLTPASFLAALSQNGIIVAGGLYPGKQGDYFRVGHMGFSADPKNGHMEFAVNAIKSTLKAFSQ